MNPQFRPDVYGVEELPPKSPAKETDKCRKMESAKIQQFLADLSVSDSLMEASTDDLQANAPDNHLDDLDADVLHVVVSSARADKVVRW